jgi:glycerol-3-phosphate dehydrogenase (NAD(P)+)
MEQRRVLVLGYGEMGHAMEVLLGGRVYLDIWEKFPVDNFRSAVLEEAAPLADLILFCLPANPHREVVTQLLPLLRMDTICLSIAKGLDERGQTAAEVFADVLGERQPYALLYGPMISEELRAGRYGFAQLGCKDDPIYRKVKDLFANTRLLISRSSDITGISWSVILKNVYAMVFGMADELQMGDNVRGYLAVASITELDQIVRGMGGDAGSPWHLAGLGDLVTTATSKDSHHHELGRMLARGESEGIKGEGVHTLEMVRQYGLFREEDYPLFELISSIVSSPGDVENRLDVYLKRCT